MRENSESAVSDPTWIAPAKIHLSSQPPISAAATSAPSHRIRRWMGLGIGLLTLALLGAGSLFILPHWTFSPPTTRSASTDISSAKPSPPAPAQPAASSPESRTQAEKSRALREQLRALQKRLQTQEVKTWAPASYAAARQSAEAGEVAYQNRKFSEAATYYQQALNQLQALQAHSEQLLTRLLQRGRQALNEGAAETAVRVFQGALRLNPENEEAKQGRRRAETLVEVQALTAKGDRLFEQGELEQAQSRYERALELDPQAETARAQLQRLERQREARQFTQAMSQGYRALAAGELEKARQAFAQAKKLNPNAAEAREGLSQVEHRLASKRITHLLAMAKELEESEQWQEAVEKYTAALSLDPHLRLAQQGKHAAAKKASLYGRMQQTLARPERLTDEAVYQEAKQLLRQAQQLDRPGSNLKAQMVTLSELLEQAATPVTVTLHSDNKTKVRLYRVGKLGKFKTKQIDLRPGQYVAVGRREGYRDVRIEFLVSAKEPPPSVVVQVEEQIPQ